MTFNGFLLPIIREEKKIVMFFEILEPTSLEISVNLLFAIVNGSF